MNVTVPNSFGTELREENDCHLPAGAPASSGGEFCSKPGSGGGLTREPRGRGSYRLKVGGISVGTIDKKRSGDPMIAAPKRSYTTGWHAKTGPYAHAMEFSSVEEAEKFLIDMARSEGKLTADIDPPGSGGGQPKLGKRAQQLYTELLGRDERIGLSVEFGHEGGGNPGERRGRYGSARRNAAQELQRKGLVDIESLGSHQQAYRGRTSTTVSWRVTRRKP